MIVLPSVQTVKRSTVGLLCLFRATFLVANKACHLPFRVTVSQARLYTEAFYSMLLRQAINDAHAAKKKLTSQEVGGAPVPEDASNIMQVVVNRLLGGLKTKHTTSIFAGQNMSTVSPFGSPTAERPKVAPVLLGGLAGSAFHTQPASNGRKARPIPQDKLPYRFN